MKFLPSDSFPNSMLQLPASEFPPPLSQRGSPQRTRRNSSAEKSRKMFARKNPAAGERIRARLQRTGKKFCFFSAVGETRASAPSALIPPDMCEFAAPLTTN